MPLSFAPFPEDAKPTAGTHYIDSNEIASAAQLYHYYLEPSVRLLAQNRMVDMGAIRPGLYDGKVGLLPGLHGDFMEKYEVCPTCPLKHFVDPVFEKASFSLTSLQRTNSYPTQTNNTNNIIETAQGSTGPPRGFIPVYGRGKSRTT